MFQDVSDVLADCDGPLEPTPWDEVMRKGAASYTGEEVFPAEDLSPSRLDQSFPDPRYGGAVPVLSVVEGCLRRQLMDPEDLLLPREQWGEMPARPPRVWADQDTWNHVAKLLVRANIAFALRRDSKMKLGDLVIEHGASGAGKPGFAKGQGP